MTKIKKKEKGRVPKVHSLCVPTNQVGRMMKHAYLKRRTQSHDEQEPETGYATGQAERVAEWAAEEMAAAIPAVIKGQLAQPKLKKRKQPELAPDVLRDEFSLSEQEPVPDTGDAAHPFEIKRQLNPPRPGPTDMIESKGSPSLDLPELPQVSSTVSRKRTVSHGLKKRSAASQLKKRIANDPVVTSPAETTARRKSADSPFIKSETMLRMDGTRQYKSTDIKQYSTAGFQNAGTNCQRRRRSLPLSQTKRSKAQGCRPTGTPKTRSTIQPGYGQRKAATPTLSRYPKSRVSPAITAKQVAQQKMKRQMLANTKKAAKSVATITKRAVQAAVKAVTHLVSLLLSVVGGTTLLMAFVCVIVIAAIASSPFGLFFAEEKNAPDTVSVAEAVSTVNTVYNARLEMLQTGAYDSVVVHGQAAEWPEVLAVFAVKLAGADVGGLDVATLDSERIDWLNSIFWDMNEITTETEKIEHETEDDSWTEEILHITITPKSADDMRTVYGFTRYQNSALDELLADRAALVSLVGNLKITSADIQKVLADLPAELSEARQRVVEKALSLVGKVNYFWGGKSSAIGWDNRWGTLQKVTAAGSPSTGTYRPFGLDCSGMIDWALRNAGLPSDGNWYIGVNLTGISSGNAQPGDMALFADASHIGIVVGRNEAGNLLVCHCSSGQNDVVITEASASGFTAIGRPDIFN